MNKVIGIGDNNTPVDYYEEVRSYDFNDIITIGTTKDEDGIDIHHVLLDKTMDMTRILGILDLAKDIVKNWEMYSE